MPIRANSLPRLPGADADPARCRVCMQARAMSLGCMSLVLRSLHQQTLASTSAAPHVPLTHSVVPMCTARAILRLPLPAASSSGHCGSVTQGRVRWDLGRRRIPSLLNMSLLARRGWPVTSHHLPLARWVLPLCRCCVVLCGAVLVMDLQLILSTCMYHWSFFVPV